MINAQTLFYFSELLHSLSFLANASCAVPTVVVPDEGA